MSDNWVVQNLENALATWNEKLAEIWQLITQSPETFKGGTIWNVVLLIHDTMQAIGLALLVLFFVVGVVKTCGSFAEIKRPEAAVKLFIRFALAKAVVTYGLELMMALFTIVQGVISSIMSAAGMGAAQETVLPAEIVSTIESCGFWESIPLWAVALIGGLFITILSFVMVLTVYGRFFRLYIYTAIAPIPLSTFAGEPSQQIGRSFLKSYAAVCLEGAIIVLACIIFSLFASSPPAVDPNAAAVTQVWTYVGELIFNLLVLVGTVKMADRVVRGKILDKSGNVLAETDTADDGSEYRYYPYGEIFAHVVGYSSQGKSGLESTQNFNLLTSDAFILEKLVKEFQDQKNIGDNVVTTLDVDLQSAAYNALGDNKGAVVIMEPSTGSEFGCGKLGCVEFQ